MNDTDRINALRNADRTIASARRTLQGTPFCASLDDFAWLLEETIADLIICAEEGLY